MRMPIYVGWDPHEMMAHVIASNSLRDNSPLNVSIHRLAKAELVAKNLYTRPTSFRELQLWDDISAAPMSTEHAIARFFLPVIRDYTGWAMFVDGDVLCRRDLDELFAYADDRFAVMCVQHPPMQASNDQVIKKDGVPQHFYSRKNWSSMMLVNCEHPANRKLTLEYLNTTPGRDLHAFAWLADYEIGSIPLEWNWLAGVSAPLLDPAIVHFTLGTPHMPYAKASAYDSEWIAAARRSGYRDVVAAAGSVGGVA